MSDQWRILVVEDEESLNWSLVDSLRNDGSSVQSVTSGADAMRVLWREEYDLIISDLKMRGADDFELLQWVRKHRPKTRLLMVTAFGSTPARNEALEGGIVSYLEKPFDLRTLKEEVRRLLQQTGFAAKLDAFDLLDVIQIITMSRKSIALLVNMGPVEQGVLRFQTGELVWAEYGSLRGEEAFFALTVHKKGMVIYQPWNEQITPNVTQPLSRLIFRALQYRIKETTNRQHPGMPNGVAPLPFAQGQEDDSPFWPLAQNQKESSPFLPLAQDQKDSSAFLPLAQNQKDSSPFLPRVQDQKESNPFLPRLEALPPVASAEQGIDEATKWWQQPAWMSDTDNSETSINGASPAPTTSATDNNEGGVDGRSITNGVSDAHIHPPNLQKTPPSQPAELPIWLTEQPTMHILSLPRPPSLSNPAQVPEPQALKRDYSKLVATLQTLRSSVPGFVASAVISLDGHPIAQVSADDLDVSPLYGYLSILQGVLHSLERVGGENYEDMIITSKDRHILLRFVGSDREAFQLLITTRETNPLESLIVMANVEGAIDVALR